MVRAPEAEPAEPMNKAQQRFVWEAMCPFRLRPLQPRIRNNMAATHWIVVADSSRGRIFEAGAEEGRLREIADLANPEGRSSDTELASYVAGEGRPGPRTATQQDSASEHSVD